MIFLRINLPNFVQFKQYQDKSGTQGQSCKAFIGLTIRAKMIGEVDPFYLKF